MNLLLIGSLIAWGYYMLRPESPYTYETHQITQFVDHYSLTTNRTFQQKYLVNKDYWCGNGCPILFYPGHDGRTGHIEEFANENTGWMWKYGEQLQAMIVFAEHRFYGDSKPFPEVDEMKPYIGQMDKLGYLTSQQALADYAQLIHSLKHHIYSAPDSPVVAVGGGYGGMLSAWLRMKYPNAVIGAWASSAPLFLRKGWADCQLMSSLTTEEYAKVSVSCKDTIAQSRQAFVNIMNGPSGPKRISELMNLCRPLTDPSELQKLTTWLIEYWYLVLMSDYQSESNYYARLPARPVVEVCKIIDAGRTAEMSDPQLVEVISRSIRFFLADRIQGDSCFDLDKPMFPKYLFEVQSGLELIFAHCANGKDDFLFPFKLDQKKWQNAYWQQMGTKPRFDMIPALYHTQDLSPYSNIIFTVPSRDPYSVACPRESLPERSIYSWPVEGAAYMEELRGSSENDTESLTSVRHRVAETIYDWFRKHLTHNEATTDSIASDTKVTSNGDRVEL